MSATKIQVNQNNWEDNDIEHWRFYSSEENWEFSIEGKLHECVETAKDAFADFFQCNFGIIQVSAWPK